MKKMEDTIAFRVRIQTLIYGILIVLTGTIYAITTSAVLGDTLQTVLLSVSGLMFVLFGVMAYLHFMTISDLKLLESVLKSIDDAVVITNKHNRIIYANDQFLKITKSPYEKIVGKAPSYFKSGVHDPAFYASMWKSIQEKGMWYGEIWDKKEDGSLYSKDLLIRAIGKQYDKPRFYIGIFKDLTPYRTLEVRTEYERLHFLPTELPNEVYFAKLMRDKINKNVPFQLLYIRIANFSYLISAHTPENFYETLKKVKKRVESMKDTLTLGQIDRETLLLIREGTFNKDDFDGWIKQFKKTIETPIASMMKFDIRTGISLFPEHGNHPDDLLTKATLAFDYTHKNDVSDYTVFDNEYQKIISDEYSMRDAIIEGLENNEFYLVYHPIFSDSKSTTMIAVEALLRWDSKKYEAISPETFIPVAEKFYLMNRIGDFVMKEALKQKSLLDETFGKGIVMSINTSATQYESENLFNTLKKALSEKGIHAHEVMIELTESSIMANIDTTVKYLERLRELGVRIALDDFGVGFSSLNYLRSMPIDIVKIDRSFVSGYPDTDDGRLAKIIIDLSNALGLRVIAEGIETEKQADMLGQAGCHLYQGYHYTKPLSSENLMKYLRQKAKASQK
ncbi:MAG: EAL and GGDEF domain-containing protein [Bacillota bacterium]